MCTGKSFNISEVIVSSQIYNLHEAIISNSELFENSDYCTVDELDQETTQCFNLRIMHLNVWAY